MLEATNPSNSGTCHSCDLLIDVARVWHESASVYLVLVGEMRFDSRHQVTNSPQASWKP